MASGLLETPLAVLVALDDPLSLGSAYLPGDDEPPAETSRVLLAVEVVDRDHPDRFMDYPAGGGVLPLKSVEDHPDDVDPLAAQAVDRVDDGDRHVVERQIGEPCLNPGRSR